MDDSSTIWVKYYNILTKANKKWTCFGCRRPAKRLKPLQLVAQTKKNAVMLSLGKKELPC